MTSWVRIFTRRSYLSLFVQTHSEIWPPYFYFESSWPTNLESVICLPLTMKISTKFEVNTLIRCLVNSYIVRAADRLRNVLLWPMTFHLGRWSYMSGHVVNPCTKFEDPTAICSWVMSSDTSTLNMILTT